LQSEGKKGEDGQSQIALSRGKRIRKASRQRHYKRGEPEGKGDLALSILEKSREKEKGKETRLYSHQIRTRGGKIHLFNSQKENA